MEKNLVIVCLKHTGKKDPCVCFWGSNCKGYALDIEKAGLYSKEEIQAQRFDERENFPVKKEDVLKFAKYSDIEKCLVVPNKPKNVAQLRSLIVRV